MNNGAFTLAYLVVSITIFICCALIAFFRKNNHLSVFACSFACFCTRAVLLSTQTPDNLIFSVLISNMFLAMALILLYCSVRVFYDAPTLWPTRFWSYLAVIFALNVYLVLIDYSLLARTITQSLVFTILFIDFFLFLRQVFHKMTFIIKAALVSSLSVTALSYILWAVLTALFLSANAFKITNGSLNTYMFVSYTITSFLWFATAILIDDSKILEETGKNAAKYRLLAESASDVIWVYNILLNKLTYISPSVINLLGYTPEEMLSQPIKQFLTSGSYTSLMRQFETAANAFLREPESACVHYIEIEQPCKSGCTIWAELSLRCRKNTKGEVEIIGASRNINERKRREAEIEYLNLHDLNTGLFNRKALRDLIAEQNANPKSCGILSVIFVDIDNFRIVNDALGHRAGDKMIAEISEKLKGCVGDRGTIFRYYGDEFIVLVESENIVPQLAKEIQDAVSSRVFMSNRFFYLTASIGCYIGQKGEGLDRAIKGADAALYVAKRLKNTITVYNDSMEKTQTRSALLEEDLPYALVKKEFELFYQPIIDARNGECLRVEALLRWNHAELGKVPPSEFIPLAEKTRLIIPITEWVVTEVCSQIRSWHEQGMPVISVGVNLSPICIEHHGGSFIDFVLATLKSYSLLPRNVKFEITEAAFMQNYEETIRVCGDLRKAGIKISLDDFGTGYSSYGYLKDLPLNFVKLDRAFLGTIGTDIKDQIIVQGMIDIFHGLGLKVIAEGVETMEQFKVLNKFECDFMQGFLFSRPLPADMFKKYYFSNDSVRLFEATLKW